ncbi:hypothetical protein D3C72_1046650 [compost metagenome]
MVAQKDAVGPQTDPADLPQVMLLVGILAHALVDEAVIELVEADLQVPRGVRPGLIAQTHAPVGVHPFEVDRIDRVFLALEPVAGNIGEDDLLEAVGPAERFVVRQKRRWQRPHIGPQQPALLLHRIGLDLDLFLQFQVRRRHIVIGLFDALPRLVEQPAVIVAAQAALLDEGVGQVGATVRALTVNQAVPPAQILVEHQILAHQSDGADGFLVELGRRRDRHPVAAQQVAHRRIRPHLGQLIVLFLTEHRPISPVFRPCRSGAGRTPFEPARYDASITILLSYSTNRTCKDPQERLLRDPEPAQATATVNSRARTRPFHRPSAPDHGGRALLPARV